MPPNLFYFASFSCCLSLPSFALWISKCACVARVVCVCVVTEHMAACTCLFVSLGALHAWVCVVCVCVFVHAHICVCVCECARMGQSSQLGWRGNKEGESIGHAVEPRCCHLSHRLPDFHHSSCPMRQQIGK